MRGFIVCILLSLLMVGCADHVGFSEAVSRQPVGFWYGLWHGVIIPLSWFVSLFNEDVAVYAIYNNGGWYDFGFIIGIGALGGSGKAATS